MYRVRWLVLAGTVCFCGCSSESEADGPGGVAGTGGTGDASIEASGGSAGVSPGDGGGGEGGMVSDARPEASDAADAKEEPKPPCTDVCGTPGCGTCPTKPMVLVPLPFVEPACDSFEIDATETTQAEYDEFLSVNYVASPQYYCDIFDTGYEPDPSKFGTLGLGPDLPVYAVDWCDANAYCEWAGKRLCEGWFAPTPEMNWSEHCPEYQSAWSVACSGDCVASFGYGNEYEDGRCNLLPDESGGVEPVGSRPGCHAGYPGLFDMLGNVWEWTGATSSSKGKIQGSSQMSMQLGDAGPAEWMMCGLVYQTVDKVEHPLLAGIRCCR